MAYLLKVFIVIPASILLLAVISGCAPCDHCNQDKAYLGASIREFRVVYIDRPKRFSVNLEDVKTHHIIRRAGSSKRCGSWNHSASPKLNDVIEVRVTEYTLKNSQDKSVYFDIDNNHVRNLFCHHHKL